MNSINELDDLTAVAADVYPTLHRMFGAYFHQDWQDEYATSTGAVQAFLREAPFAVVDSARRELDLLLASTTDDELLGSVLRLAFDCNYVPQVDELSNRAWLMRVRALMQSVPSA
jgi:hypothetical protein